MSKILRQNVGGVDFTMVGCALTGVCPTAAADYVKQITLSDGDVIEDGMMMVVTFANGNSAGNAPNTKTIYSSDQINYFEDDQLTIPFTLAPEGCYEIEYTGTANAYTYTDYPVFQVGSVSGPVCDYRGHIASGDLWNAGDSVQCMLKEGKFLLLGGSGGADIDVYDSMAELIADLPNLQEGQFAATKDTGDELAQPVDVVEEDNLHAVTSSAVAESLKAENVYTDGNKVFVTRVGGVYIFTLQGCTLAQIETAISNLGITTQKVQLAVMSRRDSSNNNVYPCTAVFNVNGTVRAWFCNAGIENQLGNTDIVYGQMIIYSN